MEFSQTSLTIKEQKQDPWFIFFYCLFSNLFFFYKKLNSKNKT